MRPRPTSLPLTPSQAPSRLRALLARPWIGPAAVALLGLIAVLVAFDPAGDYPGNGAGPGLTVDERFNVVQGVLLADATLNTDPAAYCAATGALPDHPPLGRLWLGLGHEFVYTLWPPVGHEVPYSIAAARPASACAFALLLFAVGLAAGTWYGPLAGAGASLALLLMPRVFGHAHLAALETCINLAYGLAVLYLAHAWTTPDSAAGDTAQPAAGRAATFTTGPTTRTALIGGLLFGAALLTKVQAILLPIPVAVWALVFWRRQALVPLLIWGATGALTFFAGWPWLWEDPVQHVLQYLGRTTDRSTVYLWYFGQSWADRDVPWHYPWLMFAVTVPLGLQLLGLLGAAAPALESATLQPQTRSSTRLRNIFAPRETLLLACLLFPLVIFSLPGVAVYDGVRLFLVAFPLWAVLIGRGLQTAWSLLRPRVGPRCAAAALTVLLALQAGGWLVAPCYLSYYNLLTGGLRGADRIGLATTYWGDSLTRDFLQQVTRHLPAGATIHVAPVLHQFQLPDMLAQSPLLREHRITLRPYESNPNQPPRGYVLIFLRQEYLPPELRKLAAGAQPVANLMRGDVLLAALYALP